MPSLPGSIARYDNVDLLDLDQIELYFHADAQRYPRTSAKLQETERRWVLFDWATFVIHQPRRNESLMRDLASAYLLSFESTLQVLCDERGISNFDAFLRENSAYDIACRGLRTIRHLEAHVQPGRFTPSHSQRVESRFAHSATGGTIGWRWEPLTLAELNLVKSKNSKLAESELSTWNQLCEDKLSLGLMQHGVEALCHIVNSP